MENINKFIENGYYIPLNSLSSSDELLKNILKYYNFNEFKDIDKIIKNYNRIYIDFTSIPNEYYKYLINKINDKKNVDEYNKYLKSVVNFKNNVEYVNNTEYGKKLLNKWKEVFNIDMPSEEMAKLSFVNGPHSNILHAYTNGNLYTYRIIKFPLAELINKNAKCLDTILIHEVIHSIENSINRSGLSSIDRNDNIRINRIINELRVQNAAIKISSNIHNSKSFIFDDANNYKNNGNSIYETILPLVKDFIDEYEDIFNEIAINGNNDDLIANFGNVWNVFSKSIDCTYINLLNYKKNNIKVRIKNNDKLNEMITLMENNYNKGCNKKSWV